MQRLRELTSSTAGPSDYDRPSSLYAAGAVGEGSSAVVRREARLVATEGDVDPARTGRGERTLPTPRDRPVRAIRSTTEPPPRGDARAELMAALRSPSALRTAILLREVLDPPVALRGEPGQR